MARCPNCQHTIAIGVSACPSCSASFTGGGTLVPIPENAEERKELLRLRPSLGAGPKHSAVPRRASGPSLHRATDKSNYALRTVIAGLVATIVGPFVGLLVWWGPYMIKVTDATLWWALLGWLVIAPVVIFVWIVVYRIVYSLGLPEK